MTKLQLINAMETIINELKGIEETELTSCVTFEIISSLNDLFDTFEEEYYGIDDVTTYEPKQDNLSHLFPCVEDLFNLSIRQPVSHDNEKTTDTELPDYLKACLSLLGV